MAEGDRERARPLAAQLPMPVLARAWQMLLKGIEEVQTAPTSKAAAEMVLVRLAYVADLPLPAELVKSVTGGEAIAARAVPNVPVPPRPPAVMPPPTAAPSPSGDTVGFVEPAPSPPPVAMARRGDGGSAAPAMAALQPQPLPEPPPAVANSPQFDPMPQSFTETLDLFERHGEVITRAQLWSQVHLVGFEPGKIEFRPVENAPRDLASRLSQRLAEWTGTRWVVAVSQAAGEPTLEQQQQTRDSERQSEVAGHPLVRAVLDAFPGATIAAVRERFVAAASTTEDEIIADDVGGDDGMDGGPGDSEEDEA
jgi:DNA polymerase-3 subunit gamma/tau